jgi:hypothetical protein
MITKALFSALLFLPNFAVAENPFYSAACPDDYTYYCVKGKCSCRELNERENVFFLAKDIPSITDLKAPDGTAGYKCVPELHQCGCYGALDCILMLLSLKVKCESFDCNDFGCACHFPNNIPN